MSFIPQTKKSPFSGAPCDYNEEDEEEEELLGGVFLSSVPFVM